MKSPKRTVEKAIARHFPTHGQQTLCITPSDFEHRWTNVVAALSDALYKHSNNLTSFGSLEILLAPSKEKLLARIAWIPEDNARYPHDERPRKMRPIPKIAPRRERSRRRNDGYDCMRINESDKLSWRNIK